jgi:hypothetical protein
MNRYYVEQVPPASRWLIEEMVAAARAGNAERFKELGRVVLPEDEGHYLMTVPDTQTEVPSGSWWGIRLPAALWALLVGRDMSREEEA